MVLIAFTVGVISPGILHVANHILPTTLACSFVPMDSRADIELRELEGLEGQGHKGINRLPLTKNRDSHCPSRATTFASYPRPPMT